MKRITTMLVITTLMAGPAVASELRDAELRELALEVFEPLPSTVPSVPGNPFTPEKIELGKSLFFDPRLSASGLFSCASCHNLATGGDDNLAVSIGHGWQKGPRNSPTVFNSVLNETQFWDGRAATLAEQAKGPIQASVEMANTPENAMAMVNSMPAYVEMFTEAFEGEAEPVTFGNLAKALEAFQATLLTPAPFDAFLNGDDLALTDEQQAGLLVFMDAGCASCHMGVNLGGQSFYPFGLVEKPGADVLPPGDKGRFAVTGTVDDKFVFRAAPLRNMAVTAPYFHSGAVWDMRIATQIMAESQLGAPMSDTELDQVVAFMHSLTGTVPPVTLPILPAETATTPRPIFEILP